MNTLQEIKSAIANLSPRDRALLAAELCAADSQPNAADLEAALERGLHDIETGRVREIGDLPATLGGWTSKS